MPYEIVQDKVIENAVRVEFKWQYREYAGDDVRSAYEYAVTSRVERVWGKR